MTECLCGHPVHGNIGGCGSCNAYGCHCEALRPFPDVDDWGRPTRKMPICPKCGNDELGLITKDVVICYQCRWKTESVMNKVDMSEIEQIVVILPRRG